MPDNLPPLAGTDDYENLVGPPPAGMDLDALLDAASDMVRAECGWHVAPTIAEDLILDGPRTKILLLPTLHLVDVESIENDGNAVAVDSIQWSTNGIVEGSWSSRRRGIRMTVRHGYEEVPAGIVALVCAVAARAAASPAGIVREQVGSASVTYSQVGESVSGGTVLVTHERSQLAKYKLPTGA